MISGLSRLPASPSAIVLDASVLINILGSGSPADLLAAIGHQLIIPEPTLAEVSFDPSAKQPAAARTVELIEAGLLTAVPILGEAARLFSLLAAEMGDGEAAAVAYAIETEAFVAIDDRKARRVALPLIRKEPAFFTLDLLLSDQVVSTCGKAFALDAVFQALVNARMRVPHQYRAALVRLLGPEKAEQCPSLGYKAS